MSRFVAHRSALACVISIGMSSVAGAQSAQSQPQARVVSATGTVQHTVARQEAWNPVKRLQPLLIDERPHAPGQQSLRLNREWTARGLPPLRVRIGINTGAAIAGNMGTDTIFNFTVLGDSVNLASRLEGVNREYGSLILIGEDTWKRVSTQFETREIDWIRVKGKQKPVAIYELLSEAGSLDPQRRELLRHFAAGLQAYRAGRWADAAAHFTSALEIDPADGPSRTFAARCEAYVTMPPSTWDGIHVMQAH